MIHITSMRTTIRRSKFGSVLIFLFVMTAFSCAPENGGQNTDNKKNILDDVDNQTPMITALFPKSLSINRHDLVQSDHRCC